MTLEGPVVLDVSQHFVERWNEIKKRKVKSDFSTNSPCWWCDNLQYKIKELVTFTTPHQCHHSKIADVSVTSTVSWLAFPHEPEYAPNEPIAREYSITATQCTEISLVDWKVIPILNSGKKWGVSISRGGMETSQIPRILLKRGLVARVDLNVLMVDLPSNWSHAVHRSSEVSQIGVTVF
jgi:hypothetical protein